MRITVARNSRELGEEAANLAAKALKEAIAKRGWARMALSTGASQLDTLAALTRGQIPWKQVELFQVNERAGLPDEHPSSCRKALKDRFAQRVPLGSVHYMDGSEESLANISREMRKAPIDLILLGIGGQGQIGFNTAPADFESMDAYRAYPAREGQEDALATMTVGEILRCRKIIACAPYGLQAENIRNILISRLTEQLPATALRLHGDFNLLLDADSAAQIDVSLIAKHNPALEMYRVFSETE